MKKFIIVFCLMVLLIPKISRAANQISVGYFEGVSSSGSATGWAYDPDSSGDSSEIQFFIDGTAQANFAGKIATSLLRTDVNSNYSINGSHGFSWVVPNKFRDGVSHSLYVYAIDINDLTGLSNVQINGSPATFILNLSSQTPVGYLEGISDAGIVNGWAYEPASSNSSISVQFFIDGTAQADFIEQVNADISRPDVNASQSINGKHGFTWAIPVSFWDGKQHSLYAFAINPLDQSGQFNIQISGSPKVFNLTLPPIPPPVSGHIQYFGYFGNGGLGGSDGDYLSEVHNYNNLAWIQGSELSKATEAENYNMKLVIDVANVFFDSNTWRLSPNYSQNWNNFVVQIRPHIKNVAAFYPLDEPYLTGKRTNVSTEDMSGYLATIASTIKQTFPDTPIGGIFSTNEIIEQAPIPANYDWLGVDCYGDFFSCSGHTIIWYYDQLKSRMTANQKLIVVPQAIFFGSNPSAAQVTQLQNRLDQFIAFAQSEPKVVAIIPFLYQTPPQTSDFIGAKNIPDLNAKFKTVGTNLINSVLVKIDAAPPATPTPAPAPSPQGLGSSSGILSPPAPSPQPSTGLAMPSSISATTQSPQKTVKLVNDKGTYYLISDGIKHGITNPGILKSYGFSLSEARAADIQDQSLPQGSLLTPEDGSLVKSKEDQTVYLISGQKRYSFTSAKVFTDLGFNFKSVLLVTNPELQILPKGMDINKGNTAHMPGVDVKYKAKIYWVGYDNQLYLYPSSAIYNSWHVANDFSRVVNANSEDLKLPMAQPVSLRVKN